MKPKLKSRVQAAKPDHEWKHNFLNPDDEDAMSQQCVKELSKPIKHRSIIYSCGVYDGWSEEKILG